MYKDTINSYHCQSCKQDIKWYGIAVSSNLQSLNTFSANGQNLMDFRPEAILTP
jgi:hypothetical protein